MLLSEKDGNSRSGQNEEAGNGHIASIIQRGRGFPEVRRAAPRLSRDADGLAAFEPVGRADLRRHGGTPSTASFWVGSCVWSTVRQARRDVSGFSELRVWTPSTSQST